MRWLRSFPARMPHGRAHVVDDLERLIIHDYDYTPLAAIGEDVCIVEWDMAVSPDDLARFEWIANGNRLDICVAPYLLYHVGPEPVLAHRVLVEDGEGGYGERWLHEGERSCDYFGFGLIYLPWYLISEFLDSPAPARGWPLYAPGGYHDTRFTDQTFSCWIAHNRPEDVMTGRRTRVMWSVRPVHLHGPGR